MVSEPREPSGPPTLTQPVRPPKERRRHKRRGYVCLNCDAGIEPAMHYCPNCGQENIDVKISMAEIFREATEEFIRFDSKLVLTLVPLIVKPGKLTQEWSAGRRTKYLSPVRLYLTVTAIFFLIVTFLYPHMGVKDVPVTQVSPTASTTPTETAPPAPTDPAAAAAAVPAKTSAPTRPTGAAKLAQVPVPPALRGIMGFANRLSAVGDPTKRAELVDQFLSKLPTALFAMLPVYALVLWVLYVRSGRFYVEHLVFSLHCHAFYFLLLTVIALTPAKEGGPLWVTMEVLASIAIPIYSFIALKRYYGQGFLKTLIKFLMLGYAYLILLASAMFVSLIIAAASLSG